MKTKVVKKYFLSGESLYYVYKWVENKSIFKNSSHWSFQDTSNDKDKAKMYAKKLAKGTLEKTIAEYGE